MLCHCFNVIRLVFPVLSVSLTFLIAPAIFCDVYSWTQSSLFSEMMQCHASILHVSKLP